MVPTPPRPSTIDRNAVYGASVALGAALSFPLTRNPPYRNVLVLCAPELS